MASMKHIESTPGTSYERNLQAGSQFQLDCRAEYFPELTAVSITWKKERREQFQCGVDSQLRTIGNASADQIPQALLRCFKVGETYISIHLYIQALSYYLRDLFVRDHRSMVLKVWGARERLAVTGISHSILVSFMITFM